MKECHLCDFTICVNNEQGKLKTRYEKNGAEFAKWQSKVSIENCTYWNGKTNPYWVFLYGLLPKA